MFVEFPRPSAQHAAHNVAVAVTAAGGALSLRFRARVERLRAAAALVVWYAVKLLART